MNRSGYAQVPPEAAPGSPPRPREVRGAVTLRRRSGWEAADLGVLLWRTNWGPLLLFVGLPLALLSVTARLLPEGFSEAARAAGWWLLPLADRFALRVVSLRFFEPRSGYGRLFRGLGGCLKMGLLGDLLWRRFSPYRSARMPVMILEKLKGGALRRRKRLLQGSGLGFGFLITAVCMVLKAALVLGENLFVYSMFEMARPGYYRDFNAFTESGNPLCLALGWFTVVLVETLYVCMGFALYINSRVETEGWDLEILFKNLSDKLSGGGNEGI